jgi:PAS domain S-box-containing protein
VEIKANLLYLQGRKTLQGIFRDITERKRAEEALRQRAEELGALQATVLDITSQRDLPALLHAIVERAAQLLGATTGGMYVCDPEKKEVRCVVSYNTPHDYRGVVLKYGEGAAGRVAETGRPLIVNDYRLWEGRAAAYEEDKPFTAVLSAPMIWQGRVIGVIHVMEESKARRFTQAELELLTLFANHAAIAVERTRTEEALKESEERFRGIAERSFDAILTVDLEGTITYASPAVERITGYSQKEIVGVPLQRFLPESDFPKAFQIFGEAMKGEAAESVEVNLVKKDGSIVCLELHSSPIIKDGKLAGLQGIAREITERKRMMEELSRHSEHLEELVEERTRMSRENEQRYRELFESCPISLWEEDFSEVRKYFDDLRSRGINDLRRYFMEHPENLARCAGMAKILDVNQATLGLYGAKTVEELRGELRRVFTHDFQDKFREELVALSEGGKRFASEFDNQTLAGDVKHVNLILSVVPGYEDTLGKVLVSIIDLTEWKRMEGELRSTKERLEYVVRSNPAVIYSGKPFADLSDWKLTYLSENVTNLLGYEAREFVGHPEFWTHVVHPNDRPSVMTDIARLWEKGRFVFEYRMRHKDGDYRWIREEATVVRDADGKPIEVNGYWIDITERKRLEEALAKSQRLATIGELAAMVGHDLRNPLQGIAGAVYYLRTEEDSKLSNEGKEMVQLIQESIEHSDKIINDLLEYSREVHLELSRTNVKSITRDALAKVKIPKGVRVVNSIRNQPPMKLDVHKMRRVFLNLIRNAVEAMPKGGTLTITSSRSGDNLHITFEDTGEGMTTETLAKLWTPLFTTKAKGMGLGLAIIKRFVEAHEGSISVETKLGKGSTFTVTLPIKRNLKGEEVKKKRRNRNKREPSS